MVSNDEDNPTFFISYMKWKSAFFGLRTKIKIVRRSCFRFSWLAKLTLKIDSIL